MTRWRKAGCRLTSHLWPSLLLIAIAFVTATRVVRADGGVVLWQQTTGPFTATVFSAETPLRPGPADISVLLEGTGGHHPVLNAHVFIELENETGMTVNAEATHGQARNKLLYCSLIHLPTAGHWKMRLIVKLASESASALGDLTVASPQPILLPYWKLVSFPPVIMTLFIINQWLRRSRVTTSKR
jgi:hypothetical protein